MFPTTFFFCLFLFFNIFLKVFFMVFNLSNFFIIKFPRLYVFFEFIFLFSLIWSFGVLYKVYLLCVF